MRLNTLLLRALGAIGLIVLVVSVAEGANENGQGGRGNEIDNSPSKGKIAVPRELCKANNIMSLNLMHYIVTTILISGCFTSTKDFEVERDQARGQKCLFPFTLNNITYRSCTYDYSYITFAKPWCSTKVDLDGNHVKGRNADGSRNWGICDDRENCPIPPRRKTMK